MAATEGRNFSLPVYPSVKVWAKPSKQIDVGIGTPPSRGR